MILLVGKSGSGKDYLVKTLQLRPVISHTTRPMRINEINGVDKWFHKGIPKRLKNVIAETTFNGYQYWATTHDLLDKDVYIIDLAGIQCFHYAYDQQFWINFDIVYVDCPGYKRLYRLIKRDGWINGIKRFVHDIKAFKDISTWPHEVISV